MIFSYKHNIFLPKTRKTGMSSVESCLSPFLGGRDLATGSPTDGTPRLNISTQYTGHIGWKVVKSIVGEEAFKRVRKVTVERNPWDKVVSDFLFQTRRGNIKCSFDKYLLNHMPQLSDYDRYNCQGVEVYQFDKLDAFMDKLLMELGLPTQAWGKIHLKKSPKRKPYQAYYENAQQIDMVANAFSREIERFGYTYERRKFNLKELQTKV